MIVERDGTAGVRRGASSRCRTSSTATIRAGSPRSRPRSARAFSPANRWHDGRSRAHLRRARARARRRLLRSALHHRRRAGRLLRLLGDRRRSRRRPRAVRRASPTGRAEHGATRLYGPINFTTAHRLSRAPRRPSATPCPSPASPTTRRGTARELQSLGFALERRYLTQRLDRAAASRPPSSATGRCCARLERAATASPPSTTTSGWRACPSCTTLADAIFAGNFAYTPMPFAEFAAALRRAPAAPPLARAEPRSRYAPDGAIAGFCLVYPHARSGACRASLKTDRGQLRA